LRKFMVAFDENVFRELYKNTKSRNISLQVFLRVVIISEWIRSGNGAITDRPTMRETYSQQDWFQTLF